MKFGVPSRVVALLAWVLLLVVVPALLYVSHVVDQLGEVRDNNLRTLSKAADATTQILDVAVGNVEKLNRCGFVNEFIRRQPRLSLEARNDGCPDEDESEAVQLPDDVEITESQARLSVNAQADWQVSVRVAEDGVEIFAELPPNAEPPIDGNPPSRTFGVQLDSILAEIPFGSALDLLLIADNAGDVIEQHRPAGRVDRGLRLTSLAGLPLTDTGEDLVLRDLQRSSAMFTVDVAGAEYELLCQPLRIRSLAGDDAARAPPATDDDDDAEEEAAPANQWTLCGLVARQSAITQSLQVAPFLALILLLVVVFAVLSWPLLKLMLMNERERLHFSDLTSLFIGTWLCLMLAAIVIFSIGAHQRLLERNEGSLARLAERIETNLQQEIHELADWVAKLDTDLAATMTDTDVGVLLDLAGIFANSPTLEGLPDDLDEGDPEWWASMDLHSTILTEWNRAGVPFMDDSAADRRPDSDVEFAFWARCGGMQAFKATIKQANTPRVSLSARNYFRAVALDRLWPESLPRTDEGAGRYVQPLQSLTTGEFATVVSVASKLEARPTAEPPSPTDTTFCGMMAAVQGNLISTTRPVLSPGYGFAVIDADGNVLLHSDERRALFENLYQEVDGGERLRSIVESRSIDSVGVNYLGIPHQFLVHPLSDLPWSVVTFADKEMINTNSLEVMAHAFLLSVIFVLLLALPMLFYFMFKGPEIPRWFWPTATAGNRSLRIAACGLAALVIAGTLLHGGALILATFAIPLVFLVVLYYMYSVPTRGRTTEWNLENLRRNVISSFAQWLVIAVLPASMFVKVSVEQQNNVLMQYENEQLATGLANRTCAIEDHYRDFDLGGLCTDDCAIPPGRLASTRDIYPSPIFEPDFSSWSETEIDSLRRRALEFAGSGTNAAGGSAAASPGDLFTGGRVMLRASTSELLGGNSIPATGESDSNWSVFNWIKPIYGETVIGTRYRDTRAIENQRALASEWSWLPEGDHAVFVGSNLMCGTDVLIASQIPLKPIDVWTDYRVLALGTILLFALLFWTRYGVRQIFFGEIEDQARLDLAELEQILDETPADSGIWIAARVSSPAVRDSLVNTGKSSASGNASSFIRVRANDFYAGPEQRSALLDLLETAVGRNSNVLVVTKGELHGIMLRQLHKDHDVRVDEPELGPDGPTDAERRKWWQLLARARFVAITAVTVSPEWETTSFWRRGLDKPVTADWLRAELDGLGDSPELSDKFLRDVQGATKRQGLERIVDYASGYYFGLWDACTEAERLVLVQIAFENVVNPKQAPTVRRLLERGLLVRDPELRLFNRSFALFITRVQDPAEVMAWEHQNDGFSWAQTRWVLIGFLVLALLFLWTTQRDLFNMGMVFLSTGAVGLPGALKLLSTTMKKSVKET